MSTLCALFLFSVVLGRSQGLLGGVGYAGPELFYRRSGRVYLGAAFSLHHEGWILCRAFGLLCLRFVRLR